MSISGIVNNSFQYSTQNLPSHPREFGKEFNQLGQDLQAGNLSAAQQDFVTLRKLAPQSQSPAAYSHILQDFNQLGQDLQTGDLSAAQQDYAKLQPELNAAAAQIRHQHRFPGGGGPSPIAHLFEKLGQALKAGNLSIAQKLYATLQEHIQQLGQGSTSTQSSQSDGSAVSVTA